MTGMTLAGWAGLVGLTATAGVGTGWWLVPDAFPALLVPPRPVAVAAAPESRAASAPPGLAASVALPATATANPAPDTPLASANQAPRFDVARVGARGMLVAAGRATPGAEVILYDGGQELGRARADARGEWVILPAESPQPGARELLLTARSLGSETVPARKALVLLVPDSAGSTQVAGQAARPTATPAAAGHEAQVAAGPLAVLLPQGAASAAPRVLQGAAGPAEATRQRLGLDVVDYDDGGAMRFAGSAAPDATVRVYVGRDHAGDAVADAGGRWELIPAQQPVLGRHILRVDQVAASGTLAARIELPFQRDRLPEAALAADRIVVQPGQSLWRIARRAYGRGVRYTVIYQANREQIRDPGRIYPGQVFAMPGEAAGAAMLQPAVTRAGSDLPQVASSLSR